MEEQKENEYTETGEENEMESELEKVVKNRDAAVVKTAEVSLIVLYKNKLNFAMEHFINF